MNFDATDSIIACSTGNITNSAIAVIRVSGTNITLELNKFFNANLTQIPPRRAVYTTLGFAGKIIDEVILTYFKGPNSYNGEDIIELGVHGNLLNIERIISVITKNSSIRTADPGEFSYRAMRNGKLSLSQVEGLDMLLNANSVFALDQGFSLLSGNLQSDYVNLRESFLAHRSSLEMGFDFLDDIGEDQFSILFKDSFLKLKNSIVKIHQQISVESLSLISPEIVIVGLPNAGKSSLFNMLLSRDRAIVSKTPGTTRDYISDRIKIDDCIFNLTDTAGIRFTSDEVESEGIEKGHKLIEKSFYKILLINPFEYKLSFFKLLEKYNFDTVVFTHSDQVGFAKNKNKFLENIKSASNTLYTALFADSSFCHGPIEPSSKFGPIEPSSKSGPIEPSLKTGPIEPLDINTNSSESKEVLLSHISTKYLKLISTNPILLDRHSEVVNKMYLLLLAYDVLLKTEDDLSIIGSELSILGHCISELIGIISPDEVLQNIFSNFCIGK